MRLAGWDIPDDTTTPGEGDNTVRADPETGIIPETITAGTTAWQRSQQLARERAHRRRGTH